MLIFNTTYHVSDMLYEKWIKWVREHHIPFMTKSGYLSKPQVAKIISAESEEGDSFSIQFFVAGLDELEMWHREFASEFQQNFSTEFGQEVPFFASVLEVIEQ